MKILPKEDKNSIPFESLLGLVPIEPILADSIMDTLLDSIVPITHPERWKRWGMIKQGRKGTKILLEGPPGCGKSTVARWLAKKVSNSIISMTMADIGSSDPGSTERHVRELFSFAKKKKNATIFMDECDALLWSRENAGKDSMFLIGVINQLLTQIESYEGLVIMATNFKKILDPALARRITYIIEIPPPNVDVRINLWKQKIPETHPITLNENQAKEIAEIKLTGSDIETAIDRTTRRCLRRSQAPTFQELLETAKEMGAQEEVSGTKKVIRMGTN